MHMLPASLFATARLPDNEPPDPTQLGIPAALILLLWDNEIAVGLANQTITPRLSKSIDMRVRFDWLQDRIKRKQFCVERPGT